MGDPLFLSTKDPGERKAKLLENMLLALEDMRQRIAASPETPVKEFINDTTYIGSALRAVVELDREGRG